MSLHHQKMRKTEIVQKQEYMDGMKLTTLQLLSRRERTGNKSAREWNCHINKSFQATSKHVYYHSLPSINLRNDKEEDENELVV